MGLCLAQANEHWEASMAGPEKPEQEVIGNEDRERRQWRQATEGLVDHTWKLWLHLWVESQAIAGSWVKCDMHQFANRWHWVLCRQCIVQRCGPKQWVQRGSYFKYRPTWWWVKSGQILVLLQRKPLLFGKEKVGMTSLRAEPEGRCCPKLFPVLTYLISTLNWWRK